MNAKGLYEPLNFDKQFFNNINDNKLQNDNVEKLHIYENTNINPPFRYYNDDRNLNFTPQVFPDRFYKTKSLFGPEKPSQTEEDEIGINDAALNKHFGYTDYGNFKIANQSLPEANKHKTTPKNNLFELL